MEEVTIVTKGGTHIVDIPPPLHNNMTMMMTHPPVPKHRDYFSTIHEQPPTTE